MLADDISDRIAIACPGPELDDIVRDMWGRHFAGDLTENEMEVLDEAARTRREALHLGRTVRPKSNGPSRNTAPTTVLRRPKRQRSPDRQASIERRRRLAASGPLPPPLACQFTVCELAALKIIGEEVVKHGVCSLHIDAIAAIAGTCRSVVQEAIRLARALGLLTVQERRRKGQRSLTNLVRVVSAEWLTWLRKGGGFRKTNTTHPVGKQQEQPKGFGASWYRYYRHYDPKEKGLGEKVRPAAG